MLEQVISNPGWELTPAQVKHFEKLRDRALLHNEPMVQWGWKRDEVVIGKRTPNSRTICFSADLKTENDVVGIERAHLFLESRAKVEEIKFLKKGIGKSRVVDGYPIEVSEWSDPKHKDYARLRLTVGVPSTHDLATIERRLRGKPRISIPAPRLVPEHNNYDLSAFAPFALCAGSGLSAESGLPLLGAIHNIFEVDNMETGKLIFGAHDGLPARVVADPQGEFEKFCQFNIDAVKAEPSSTHLRLRDLYQKGVIKQVFTDNMDDVFGKAGIPYTRTRLSIFPDRYPAEFHPEVKSLLIIGVAVDRRSVIKQARAKGLKIISINPVFGVAPHSRNMDYLSEGDIFYRGTAGEALPKIIEASGF